MGTLQIADFRDTTKVLVFHDPRMIVLTHRVVRVEGLPAGKIRIHLDDYTHVDVDVDFTDFCVQALGMPDSRTRTDPGQVGSPPPVGHPNLPTAGPKAP